MAGDWIKLEVTTPDKPEVARLADILNIDHDSALGKAVRFWIWADQQSVDGYALGVTEKFLDRLTNCPGFTAGLIEVGWLTSRNGRLSVPNFDRHNGQTAKNRALSKDRMKRSRYAPAATKAQPETEKRREEKIKTISPSPPLPAPPIVMQPFLDTVDPDPMEVEFINTWNATKGAIRCRQLSRALRNEFYDRLSDPVWAENWKLALEKFPLPFWADRGGVGIATFLEPKFVDKTLGNSYAKEISRDGSSKTLPPGALRAPDGKYDHLGG